MDPSMFVLTAGVLGVGFAVAKTLAAVGLGVVLRSWEEPERHAKFAREGWGRKDLAVWARTPPIWSGI